MLKSIFIKDFTLIDELNVEFDAQLNILTGETGAGKSIIIDAIDAALGARTAKDIIKNGRQKALIELCLEVKNPAGQVFLQEQGIDMLEDDSIILSREITSAATRSRINGVLVTQNVLQELKNFLIDIHSQHQTYKYLQPKTHIDLLDGYGDKAHQESIVDYDQSYKDFVRSRRALEQKIAEDTNTKEREEFLKFQIDEIEKAEIDDLQEFEKLKAQREKIVNAQELKEVSYSSYYSLYGEDGSILDVLSSIESKLIKASQMDKELSSLADNVSEGAVVLKDLAESLRDYADALSYDQQKLEEIEDRLDFLEKLRRKYGATLEGILAKLEIFRAELDNLQTSQDQIEALQLKVQELDAKTDDSARILSNSRKQLGQELSGMVEVELHNLAMPHAKFQIGFSDKKKDSRGIDDVEFLISTNPGEELKGLARIASGGEISRVMLATKSIFASSDKVGTVIFDEIDTGISGPTLQSVANKMRDLSLSHQIICITHNPIIAAAASRHFQVTKYQSADSTSVSIDALDYQGRLEALSKIAGGQVDDSSLAFAQRLLAK